MTCPTCGSVRVVVKDSIRSTTNLSRHRQSLVETITKQNTILRRRRCLNPECFEEWWTKETIIERPLVRRRPGGQPNASPKRL